MSTDPKPSSSGPTPTDNHAPPAPQGRTKAVSRDRPGRPGKKDRRPARQPEEPNSWSLLTGWELLIRAIAKYWEDPNKYKNWAVLAEALEVPDSSLRKVLKTADRDAGAFVPGGQWLIEGKNHLFQDIPNDNRCARAFADLKAAVEGLRRQIAASRAAEADRPLGLAASDAVTHFFLPKTMLKAVFGGRGLLTRRFVPGDIAGLLRSRAIDLAVGWDGDAYESKVLKQDELGDEFEVRSLSGSVAQVVVLFHPDCRRLVEEVTRDDWPGDIDPELLAAVPLFHPDLPAFRTLAKAIRRVLGGSDRGGVYEVDHLSAVVTAVQAQRGAGLFCGIPWLLRELKAKHQLLAAPLRPGKLTLPPRFGLVAVMRKADESDVTQRLDKAVRGLADELDRVTREGWNEGDWVIEAVPLDPADLLPVPGQDERTFYFYRVATSGSTWVLRPEWHERQLRLKADGAGGPTGFLYGSKGDEPKFSAYVTRNEQTIGPNGQPAGLILIRFAKINPDKNGRQVQSIAYFSHKLSRGGEPVGYVGTLSHFKEADAGGQLLCSPVIVSERHLTPTECREIVRNSQISFVLGDTASLFDNKS